MRLLFWLIAIPVLAFAGAFAAANPDSLTLKLWPLPFELVVPVYVAVLGAFFLGFVIAALWFWAKALPLRLARRRLARHERELEDETRRLRGELETAQRGAADSASDAETRRRLIAAGD